MLCDILFGHVHASTKYVLILLMYFLVFQESLQICRPQLDDKIAIGFNCILMDEVIQDLADSSFVNYGSRTDVQML